ncbi:MAG: DUF4157 domain-containing protein [Acidobacteria bacterium]|nr:DUF4157 domain-containing protein [Acidobacteriota bacterium]MCA1611893.1 DUF4157 domain-containing protein [Acidobacteriota bacterium]
MRLHTHWFARVVARILRADGVTFGRNIFLSADAKRAIAEKTEPGARLIAHEIAHVGQFARHGFLGFLFRYGGAYVKGRLRGLGHSAAYGRIPFEVEARTAEDEAMWKAGLGVSADPPLASFGPRGLRKPAVNRESPRESFPPDEGDGGPDPET